MAIADPKPVQDANDGIRGQVGMVRQEGSLDNRAIQIAVGFPPAPPVTPQLPDHAFEKLK
jgi:hypothetical protein